MLNFLRFFFVNRAPKYWPQNGCEYCNKDRAMSSRSKQATHRITNRRSEARARLAICLSVRPSLAGRTGIMLSRRSDWSINDRRRRRRRTDDERRSHDRHKTTRWSASAIDRHVNNLTITTISRRMQSRTAIIPIIQPSAMQSRIYTKIQRKFHGR